MEKKYVPGADYEEVKKGSRRKKKTLAKDESSEAGPSSTGPPVPKPLSGTSSGTVQTLASTGARQPTQTSNQPTPATSSSTRPTPSSAQTGTRQAGQASTQSGQATISTNTPGPAFLGAELSKGESSKYGAGQQEVVRLRGQPSRPVSGPWKFKTVALATNYFKLTHGPSQVLWHYGVIVQPEAKGPKLTQVIKTALNSKDFKPLSPYVVTDFSTIMLSMQEIPNQYRMFKISYHSEVETQASDNAKEYNVSLDLKGSIDLNKEVYLNSADISSSGLPVEQALDIILGHHRKLSDKIAIVNKRKAFSLDSDREDQSELETAPVLIALRGYFSSVRMSQSSLLVNVNVCHGAFYKAFRALTDVIKWLEATVDRSKVPGLLRGLRVNSTHVPRVWSIWGYPRNGDGRGYMLHPPRFNVPNAIKYTPDQVSFFYDAKPKETSTGLVQTLSEDDKKNAKEGRLKPHNDHCSCLGEWLTVTKYFEKVRRAPLLPDERGQPIVNVGSNKRPTYLPSHLCRIRPGQVSKLKLEGKQTSGMIKFAVRNPNENAKSITIKGFNTLGFTANNEKLKRFKIEVNKDMVNLHGRILPSPDLLYAGKTPIRGPSWSLDQLKFRKPMELTNWACTRIIQDENVDISIDEASCAKRLTEFQTHLGKKGIKVERSQSHGDLRIRGPFDYHRLDKWIKSSRDDYDVRFLLFVLPQRTSSELYNYIKRFGDVGNGVHTVCVKLPKFGTVPYDDNVALKINLKLKGTNHILEESAYGDVFKQETMVVGIDVTHPPPGAEGAPSVAAVVASCDKYLSQWPADLRINKSRQEMVKLLRQMLTTRLEHYKKTNQGSLPENILIYRDGVGEGQYKIVLEEELPRLRDACQGVYGKDYVEGVYPRISLIVVGKRHHTRFYKTAQGALIPGKPGNPQAGTIVDNTITQDCNWDFFLQSHTAITGTARPAHYFVLVDEIFRAKFTDPVRQLERLTNNMCHLYGKATVSVSIPPAVYYADKACDRGRRYLSRVFEQDQQRGDDVRDSDVKVNEYLEDTMFYI